MLIPDRIEDEKLSKRIFICNQGTSERTSRNRPNVIDKYALDCVTTTVLILGNKVLVLNITEMSEDNKKSLKAALGNFVIHEVEAMKDNKISPIENIDGVKKIKDIKISEVNCHLDDTTSNKNPFDQYCNKNKGITVNTYDSLDKYKRGKEIL